MKPVQGTTGSADVGTNRRAGCTLVHTSCLPFRESVSATTDLGGFATVYCEGSVPCRVPQARVTLARIWTMGLSLSLKISSLSSRRRPPLLPRKETSPARPSLPTGPASICLTQMQNLEPRVKLKCKLDLATGESTEMLAEKGGPVPRRPWGRLYSLPHSHPKSFQGRVGFERLAKNQRSQRGNVVAGL